MSGFKPYIKIKISGKKVFFGPGAAELLELIEKSSSVRHASEKMTISYSKAWKIIKTMEEEAKEKIVIRVQGGKEGGNAALTEYGKQLLQTYRYFETSCQDFIGNEFLRFFNSETLLHKKTL